MKPTFLITILMAGNILFYSCKGNKKQDEQTTPPAQETTVATTTTPEPHPNMAEPKSYNIVATPDSASLGKDKELLLKIKNLKVLELSDPEGKVTGLEFSYDMDVTNRSSVDHGGGIVIDPSKFRLELDNGTKISHDTYNSAGVDPESTKISEGNKFKLPVGTKPVALDLFYDETRAVLKLDIK